jgi:Hg(II)-responsive transcriptional regulator
MPMTIGQVAGHAGVSPPTVRYYERRGLVPQPARTAAGYRQDDLDTVRRLRFIKRAQEMGFSLREIHELLDLRIDRVSACAGVEARTRRKLALVEKRIAELLRVRRSLLRLARACRRRERTAECPVLEILDEPPAPATTNRCGPGRT